MMIIKAITFDLDNTLWDIDPVIRRAELALLNWFSEQAPEVLQHYDLNALVALKRDLIESNPELGYRVSDLRKAVIHQLLSDHADIELENQLAAMVEAAFETFYQARNDVELYPEALPVLEQLAQEFSLGALTNGNANLGLIGLDHLFDFHFSAEQVGQPKPEPALFHAALRETQLHPAEILHIGDSIEHDVLGARRLGMQTVWYNPQQQSWPTDSVEPEQINDLRQLPDLIRQLNQIWGQA